MYNVYGKYGNINIDGISIDIEKNTVDNLNMYLQKLEKARAKLIKNQYC